MKLMLLSLMLLSGSFLRAQSPSGFDIIIINPTDTDDVSIPHPHLMPPAPSQLYAVFNTSSGVLSINIPLSMAVVRISVSKNNVLVTELSNPVSGGMTDFNLSVYGSGFFCILLTTKDGDEYCATISL